MLPSSAAVSSFFFYNYSYLFFICFFILFLFLPRPERIGQMELLLIKFYYRRPRCLLLLLARKKTKQEVLWVYEYVCVCVQRKARVKFAFTVACCLCCKRCKHLASATREVSGSACRFYRQTRIDMCVRGTYAYIHMCITVPFLVDSEVLILHGGGVADRTNYISSESASTTKKYLQNWLRSHNLHKT